MPAALLTPDQWQEVRATATATGSLKEAARLHGVSYPQTKVRAHRESWPTARRLNAATIAAKNQARERTAKEAIASRATDHATTATCATLTSPDTATALEKHLRTTREEFQTFAASAVRNAARAASRLDDGEALKSSKKLADVVGAGTKLHGIGGDKPQAPVVNVALIRQGVPAEVLDNYILAED